MGNYEKLSTNELKNTCDHLLREFLIKKSVKNSFGYIFCPLSKRWWEPSRLHVCHIIDRAKMITRYSPANVFLGLDYSNTFEAKIRVDNFQSLHHKKIYEYFGKDHIDFLQSQSEIRKVHSREDYYDLIKFFKEEIDG